MDIHITYETLFDLLRKERSLEELQPLDTSFWYYVVTYLQERKAFFERTSSIEQEKTRFQLQNIKRIIREIYQRRERKIISLALNVNKSENTTFFDTKNMLNSEKQLFQETVSLLNKYKADTLTKVTNYEFPIGVEVPEPREHEQGSQTTQHKREKPKESEEPEEKAASKLKVEFTNSVPKFIGKAGETYGPYESGMTVDLPPVIANILIKKGKAKEV
jgi:DNA replication initiation complex subunit (GINS family)